MIPSTLILLGLSVAVFGATIPNEPIPIVRQDAEVSFDGSFRNSYETGNGIILQEVGTLKNAGQKDKEAEEIKGTVSWTAPDGTKYDLSWIADEFGARFDGRHLPTPPPVPELPEAVKRALAWIETHSTTESPKLARF